MAYGITIPTQDLIAGWFPEEYSNNVEVVHIETGVRHNGEPSIDTVYEVAVVTMYDANLGTLMRKEVRIDDLQAIIESKGSLDKFIHEDNEYDGLSIFDVSFNDQEKLLMLQFNIHSKIK